MGVCMYECCTVRYLADISPWPPLVLIIYFIYFVTYFYILKQFWLRLPTF